MKLRISGNSIRLRLSQRDVNLLVAEGQIAEKLDFPSPALAFEYHLSILKSSDIAQAMFDGQKMIFKIPQREVTNWANSNQEGIYKTIDIKNSQVLDLQIEKDYKCLHKDDDENDTFPNPREEGK